MAFKMHLSKKHPGFSQEPQTEFIGRTYTEIECLSLVPGPKMIPFVGAIISPRKLIVSLPGECLCRRHATQKKRKNVA
jgi:hypothetical protein